MSKKKVIHTDLNAYKAAVEKQSRMQKALDIIFKEFTKAGIEVNDIREVIKNGDPATFARESYWQTNRRFFPPGIDATTAINSTAYDEKTVQAAWNEYKQIEKTVKPLTIREDSVEISVKENDYNWYLLEEKKETYEALEKFIQAAEDLNKLSSVNFYDLQKAVNYNNAFVKDGKLAINVHNFKA